MENNNTIKEIIKACDKLTKLEKIEEYLGIDLLTLFETLKLQKVYTVDWAIEQWDDPFFEYDLVLFDFCNKKILLNNVEFVEEESIAEYVSFPLKTYGKNWALTKEELQKARESKNKKGVIK